MDTTFQPQSSALDTAVDGFYKSLGEGEAIAYKKMAVAHDRIISQLNAELKKLEKLPATDDGSASWLQRERLSRLILQGRDAYDSFGKEVGLLIPQSQLDAAQRANDSLQGILYASPGPMPLTGSFSKLNERGIEQAVATLNEGSPFREITDSYGEQAAKDMNRIFLQGVGSGAGPMAIARDMVKAGEITHHRAKTLMRTEIMRINREVSRRSYLANSDVVKGWRWYARCDVLCCPVCWAMHGRQFKLQTKMATHPNCRCINLPVLYTYEELGIFGVDEVPDSPTVTTLGVDRFKTLSDDDQKTILGKGAYTAYKGGLIDLPDLVGESYSPKWGYGKYRRPLKDLVGQHHAKTFAKGEIPPGVTGARPQILDAEKFGDPFNPAKEVLANYADSGKFSEDTVNMMQNMLETGQWDSPESAIKAMDAFYDDQVNVVKNDVWNLYNDDFIDEAMKNDLLADLDTYTADQLQELMALTNDIKQEAIAKRNLLEAAKAQKAHDIDTLLQEAVDLGVMDGNAADVYMQKMLVDDTLESLEAIYDDAAQFLAKNHPQNLAKESIQEAFDAGAMPQDVYSAMMDTINTSKDKAVWDSYKATADDMKLWGSGPSSGDIYVKHPHMAQKLDEMVNQGKISNKYKNQLVDEYANGKQTAKEFSEWLEKVEGFNTPPVMESVDELIAMLDGKDLPNTTKKFLADMLQNHNTTKGQFKHSLVQFPDKPVAKNLQYTPKNYPPGSVSKSSSQLLQEIQDTTLTPSTKQGIISDYKAKAINKEEMQKLIDDATFKELKDNTTLPLNVKQQLLDDYAQGNISLDTMKYQGKLGKYSSNPPASATPSYTPPPTPKPASPPSNPWGPNVELNQYGVPKTKLDPAQFAGNGAKGPKPDLVPNSKPGAIPKAGKGPYKKNVDGLEQLKNRGVIDQSEVDRVYDLWNTGQIKNKDIENYISDLNIYDSGNSFLRQSGMSANDIENFSWDRHAWDVSEHKAHYKSWSDKATAEQRQIAKDYTGSFYSPLNKYTRGGHLSGYSEQKLKSSAEKLQDSFENAVIPKDMVVSRGTTINRKYDWATADPGDLLVEHGFMSTTTEGLPTFSSSAYDPEKIGARFFIYTPKGAKALDLRAISAYKSEKEILFPPGSIFRLIEKRPRGQNDVDLYMEWVGFKKDETPFRKK